jgi:GTP cyclohydrolase I
MLRALIIDVEGDHNTNGTARRIAKMYVDEVFAGRYQPCPETTDFPNAKGLDEVYTLGPISVSSACSHHFAPIVGRLWVGVIPGDRVIGISKFARLARWVMSRPQIQEEAAVMLADEIERRIKPKGLALVIQAEHTCMTWRGIREAESKMTSSIMRGAFKTDEKARAEFLSLIRQ